MKNSCLVFLLLLLLTACTQSLKVEDAVKVSDQSLKDMKDENYDHFLSYYSNDFFVKTPLAEWIAIQKQAKEQFGVIQNYELLNFNVVHKDGEQDKIELEYKVIHTNRNSKQLFTIVKEDGKYKIWGHHIKIWKD